MGNTESTTQAQQKTKQVLKEWQDNLTKLTTQTLLEDPKHSATQFIDQLCSPYMKKKKQGDDDDDDDEKKKRKSNRNRSFDDDDDDDDSEEDYDDDEEETYLSDAETTLEEDRRRQRLWQQQKAKNKSKKTSSSKNRTHGNRDDEEEDSRSLQTMSYSDDDDDDESRPPTKKQTSTRRRNKNNKASYSEDDDEEEEDDTVAEQRLTSSKQPSSSAKQHAQKQPLPSAFAKKCFFTKQGIHTYAQHYEGLTLTGNIVLMLAAAMKLKGCPTICDEDLRRVEQLYPHLFAQLPQELLLSSGWRRISKFCHFSRKPIPDGVPFFHSKRKCHAESGGYYFLLASAVGMIRPMDVEPLTRDTLVLLETDYPNICDQAPVELIEDPTQWTLVDKFCFFSGGPINVEEDVYYEACLDNDNWIYMLAFLSPSLTPTELYKLNEDTSSMSEDAKWLLNVNAVEDVEAVYDLTDRDFDDLQLYHLGPCQALPSEILQPQAWNKVLPPPFLAAKQQAVRRAMKYQQQQQQHHGAAGKVLDAYYQQGGGQFVSVGDDDVGGYGYNDDHDEQEDTQLGAFGVNSRSDVGYDDDDDGQDDTQLGAFGTNRSNSREYMQVNPSNTDSMQFTADSTLFHGKPFLNHHQQQQQDYNHHHHAAAGQPYYSNGVYDDDVPLDEAAQYAYNRRTDPPEEDEPPSLRKQQRPYANDDEVAYDEPERYQTSHDDAEDEMARYSEALRQQQHQQQQAMEHNQDPEQCYYDDNEPQNDNGPFLEDDDDNDDEFDDHDRLPTFEKPQVLPPMSPRSQQATMVLKARDQMRRQQRLNNNDALSPTSDIGSESILTWESGSNFTGGEDSSMWTDGSFVDRNCRRALILQMAKARMKKDPEEKKMENNNNDGDDALDTTADFDLTGDLD